jgi:DNA-binding transcriptional ArsR family regulator
MSAKFVSYDLDQASTLGRSAASLYGYLSRWMPYAKYVHDGKYWVFRTLEQMADDLGLSIATIRRAIEKLVDAGLIIKEQLLKHKYQRVMYYSVLNFLAPPPDQTDQTEDVKMITSDNESKTTTRKEKSKKSLTPIQVVRGLIQKRKNTEEIPKTAELTRQLGVIEIEVKPGIKHQVLNDSMWQEPLGAFE